MLRRHRKGHITRTRNRDAKGIWPAIMSNKQCYLLLKIVDGPTHAEFIEDNCETRMDMRAYRWQDFKIKNQSEDWTFNLQMDRTFCIPPEDAMLAQDKYLSTSVESLVRPADISSEESHLWHTAGGRFGILRKVGSNTDIVPLADIKCKAFFCEYDANTRKGIVLIAYNGKDIPWLWKKHPELLQDIRAFGPNCYDWMVKNW